MILIFNQNLLFVLAIVFLTSPISLLLHYSGNKGAQDALDKSKTAAESAIDAGADKAGVGADQAAKAKQVAGETIDKVKADIA